MTQAKTTYAVFCDMLRHESAKPLVARARNFVERFPEGLSRYEAADRVHAFLTQTEKWMFSDIVVFMAECDEEGIANACESLEKLVMCRLYTKVFDVFDNDAEEDVRLQEHITSLAWVEPKHLGIPSIEPSLWPRVIQELMRMSQYKAPGDKLICVVNAAHIINDVLKRGQAAVGGQRPLSADDFLPLLIFAIMRANPPQLHSNAEFLAAFRHPSRLNGEHAYWVTMFCSAKEFARQAGPATLDISPEDYTYLCAATLESSKCKDDTQILNFDEQLAAPATAPQVHVKQQLQEQQQQSQEELKHTLLVKDEVLVYEVSPSSSSTGHKSANWKRVIWKGPCKIISREKDLAIKMLDRVNGQLFAECIIPSDEYHKYVEPVIDSSQRFAVRIQNGAKHALIGLGFDGRDDAADFERVLNDFKRTSVDSDNDVIRSAESNSQPAAPEQAPAQGSTTIHVHDPRNDIFDPNVVASLSCGDPVARTLASGNTGGGYSMQGLESVKPELDMTSFESIPSPPLPLAHHEIRRPSAERVFTQELIAAQEQVFKSGVMEAQPKPVEDMPMEASGPSSQPQVSAAQAIAMSSGPGSSQLADPFAEFVDMSMAGVLTC